MTSATDQPNESTQDAMRSPWAVVGAGAATLFVELALIRYVPGQIRVLGYFTNFVLLAAFLGFGVGMLVGRRWPERRWVSAMAPAALFLVVGLTDLGGILNVLPSSEQFLFLEYRSEGPRVPLYPFLTASFALLACSFVPLGHAVWRSLDGNRPLYRYGLNILGSLLGIGLFVVLSALGAPPFTWVLLAALWTWIGLVGASRRAWVVGAVAAVAVSATAWQATKGAEWSPYQKITTGPVHVLTGQRVVQEWKLKQLSAEERRDVQELPEADGFTIRVNDDSYQTPLDLSDDGVARHPALRGLRQQYDLPFKSVRDFSGDVLVLGAGAGNDVAAALRAGASHVDAVEIDPVIVRLGARHPENPYGDPRVHVHVTDARTYLARTNRSYDMVLFGLLDSHVLMSSKSNVRLDSFVFTRECFALARSRLKPKGVLVLSHAVGTPWFIDRMRATLADAFGKPPFVLTGKVQHPIGVVYAAGDNVKPGKPPQGYGGILEDDWPFVYLKDRAIPWEYLVAMMMMGLLSVAAVRGVTGSKWEGVDLHFFALGAGFLLLETRGLSVLALHLGSTWSVNAAVFAGVLVMALLATMLRARLERAGRIGMPRLAYWALFGLLAVNFLVPLGALSSLPFVIRLVSAVGLVSLPLFASGIVFAASLSRVGSAGRAVASNLLGAMCGGLAEYLSMITGFRVLLLLGLVFYLLALLTDLRGRRAKFAVRSAG